MTQFLKSTLFPDFLRKNSSKTLKNSEVNLMRARIELLERENQKSFEAIQALSQHCKDLSLIVSTLANDVNTMANYLIDMQSKSSADIDILRPWDDDDDGYLH